jgi:hypothetical protein
MAADDSILLGPGHEMESPKTLGVLAHELTHIARGRETGFVPPIVRADAARKSSARRPNSVPDTTDEEGVARRAESRVAKATEQTAQEQDATDHSGNAEHSAGAITKTATRLVSPISFPAKRSEISPDSPVIEESWGGLPAPWEPMPDWVSAPPEAQPELVATEAGVAPSISASAAAPAAESAAPARAESGRSLPEADSPPPAEAHEHPEEGKHPEPDLDAMARQVYSIVRRRLAADRRREFMQ